MLENKRFVEKQIQSFGQKQENRIGLSTLKKVS
jgi:hypothetical protein